MPGKLYIIANATNGVVNFANTESVPDALKLTANAIMYSGGKDGNFCDIPTCESPGDFAKHHMSLLSADNSFQFYFWKNNSQGNIVYYSTQPAFTPSSTMPGGGVNTFDAAALLIYKSGGTVGLQMSNVTAKN